MRAGDFPPRFGDQRTRVRCDWNSSEAGVVAAYAVNRDQRVQRAATGPRQRRKLPRPPQQDACSPAVGGCRCRCRGNGASVPGVLEWRGSRPADRQVRVRRRSQRRRSRQTDDGLLDKPAAAHHAAVRRRRVAGRLLRRLQLPAADVGRDGPDDPLLPRDERVPRLCGDAAPALLVFHGLQRAQLRPRGRRLVHADAHAGGRQPAVLR